MVLSHLQFADDTLCTRETTLKNFLTLKTWLRDFEMASGLKVIFTRVVLWE